MYSPQPQHRPSRAKAALQDITVKAAVELTAALALRARQDRTRKLLVTGTQHVLSAVLLYRAPCQVPRTWVIVEAILPVCAQRVLWAPTEWNVLERSEQLQALAVSAMLQLLFAIAGTAQLVLTAVFHLKKKKSSALKKKSSALKKLELQFRQHLPVLLQRAPTMATGTSAKPKSPVT
jgi:hypothetical protein